MKKTFCYRWSPDRQINQQFMREFSDAGAQYVVLTAELLKSALRDTQSLLDFRTDLAQYHLEFLDAHAPFGEWSDPSMPLPEWHETVVLRQKLVIALCARCGIKTLTFHTGNTRNSIFGAQWKFEDYYQTLLRTLEVLLPDAAKYGITIALENQWTPLNHSKYLLPVLKYFNAPNLGLCYDSGHGNLMETQNRDADSYVPNHWIELGMPLEWDDHIIEKFQPYLVNCHLHDNNGKFDQHLLPGSGTVNWERIKHVLRHAPNLQCIQSEVAPHDYKISDLVQTFYRYFGDL